MPPEEMHDLIMIQKQETDKLRERVHALCNEVATMQTLVYKLDKKTVCDNHSDFVDKIEKLFVNSEVIKTKMETIACHVAESKIYRDMTTQHEVEINSLKGTRTLAAANLIVIVLAIIGYAVTWGGLNNQVSTNTSEIQKLHAIVYNYGK